jgi:hypothetical protein
MKKLLALLARASVGFALPASPLAAQTIPANAPNTTIPVSMPSLGVQFPFA